MRKKWVLACQSFGECTAKVKLELTDFRCKFFMPGLFIQKYNQVKIAGLEFWNWLSDSEDINKNQKYCTDLGDVYDIEKSQNMKLDTVWSFSLREEKPYQSAKLWALGTAIYGL